MNAKIVMLVTAWCVSLLGVGLWAQGGSIYMSNGHAIRSVNGSVAVGPVITGADIGFQRVMPAPGSAAGDGSIVGYFVVKIGDEWMRVSAPVGMQRSVR